MRPKCIVDSAHGVYIPQIFAENNPDIFDNSSPEVSTYNLEVLLSGPDHEEYWDVWDEVLNYGCPVEIDGELHVLHHDMDLFYIPEGFDPSEDWG